MNRLILNVVVFTTAIAIGVFIGRGWLQPVGDLTTGQDTTEREVLYWRAPMDPSFRSDSPGKSPMGMDLVPVYADASSGDEADVITISPSVASNLGVRTAAVETGPLSRRIETVGYVAYDEETLSHINTRVDGWIERLVVKAAGDPVRQGDLLFELYSPTLVNTQEEHLAALNSGKEILHGASLERLSALGMTDSEIDRLHSERRVEQLVRVFAEKDGIVAHLGVREGAYVTPAAGVMSVAELDPVWVMAEVFERQAAWVKPSQRAEVELDYLPGEQWSGTVDYVYPELDPQTRSLKVRLRFDNSSEVLLPNMFARVRIFGDPLGPVIHIPRQALIRGGSVDRVVVSLGEGRFRAQPVLVGVEAGDRVEIRDGLSADARIVTSGQFLIDSESNIEAAFARMDPDMASQMEQSSPADVEAEPVAVDTVTVEAIVRGMDAAANQVTLEHPAIEVWSWPAMTMSFDVAESQSLADMSEGQVVEVVIRALDPGYEITRISPGATAESAEEHDHAAMEAQ